MSALALPCAIVRGGTSKGIFVREEHLPADEATRRDWLVALLGSPDPRQIDGLGGADPLTSKVAIVARSRQPDADLDYESVEVGVGETAVREGLLCGNLLAGVAAYARAEGLAVAPGPLRIHCRSNGLRALAHPLRAGRVHLTFPEPDGPVTGALLPAGEPLTVLRDGEGTLPPVSMVDAGTLYGFVSAASLGLTGHEAPAQLDGDRALQAQIERLRAAVAACVTARADEGAAAVAPARVKLAMLAAPLSGQGGVDLVARVLNRRAAHKAFAVSGAICLAAACALPGTVAQEVHRPPCSPFRLRIGHPSGVLELVLRYAATPGRFPGLRIESAEMTLSARVLMRGTALLPEDLRG